ncbi:MAG: efflux RND transporter periplasmic adaptor subunit [Planctomycetaceae bacterium]
MTKFTSRIPASWLRFGGLALVVVVAILTRSHWLPPVQQWVESVVVRHRQGPSGHDPHSEGKDAGGDPHAGHDHAAHDDGASLALSPQAMRSIGLNSDTLRPIELQTFRRSITIPAMVTERPGRTQLRVSTPMAGVITHVHAVQGEAVKSGTFLFEIRITGEELVDTQTALLQTVGDLDVEKREIARLTEVTQSGAISQKTLLERQYAKEKLEVLMAAQREALRLHGLSERQIDDIIEHRRLLRDLRIVAPSRDSHEDHDDELHLTLGQEATSERGTLVQFTALADDATTDTATGEASPTDSLPARNRLEKEDDHHSENPQSGNDAPLLTLQEVLVHKGESVAAGTTLAVLSDFSSLYVEGRAFEQDVTVLHESAARGWKMTALFEGPSNRVDAVPGLALAYSASQIDVGSRTLPFYVELPNEILRDTPSENGQRFLSWKYRPGQRLQLQVPVEESVKQIVLPVEAIARDGAESYVFQQNGDHFDRIAVQVLSRDSREAVIAQDGSIFPGDVVALKGAHQMLMALKNQSGGGVDPHAGHNH